jgi:hypothetical protein
MTMQDKAEIVEIMNLRRSKAGKKTLASASGGCG